MLSPAFKAMFGYQDHELANSTDTWAKLIVKRTARVWINV
jgi:hypothetical protein